MRTPAGPLATTRMSAQAHAGKGRIISFRGLLQRAHASTGAGAPCPAPIAAQVPPALASDAQTTDPRAAAERRQKQRATLAVAPKSMRSYERALQQYLEFCTEMHFDRPVPRQPLDRVPFAEFLWSRCARAENARSWKQWQSRVHSCMTKKWDIPRLSEGDKRYLYEQRVACAKSIGVKLIDIEPMTEAKLQSIWNAASHILDVNLPLLNTFRQMVLSRALTLRPEDLYLTGAGDPADRVRASDVKFLPPQPELGLPLGSIEVTVRNSKRTKMTGEGKATGESHRAGATGGPLCPLGTAKALFKLYGLDDVSRAGEPLVASMDARGQRFYAHPESWQGARLLPGREYNDRVKKLCDLAGLPRCTGRGSRYGSSADMMAAGVPETVSNLAGGWAPGSQRPYKRMTPTVAGFILQRATTQKEALGAANASILKSVS